MLVSACCIVLCVCCVCYVLVSTVSPMLYVSFVSLNCIYCVYCVSYVMVSIVFVSVVSIVFTGPTVFVVSTVSPVSGVSFMSYVSFVSTVSFVLYVCLCASRVGTLQHHKMVLMIMLQQPVTSSPGYECLWGDVSVYVHDNECTCLSGCLYTHVGFTASLRSVHLFYFSCYCFWLLM